jgi:hypothetical protein
MTNVTRLAAAVLLFSGSACLDLDPTGKLFAGDGPPACMCALPAPTCAGGTRRSATSSTCLDDGGCDYQWAEATCPGTCTNGACDGAPCVGVICTQPPASHCVDAHTLRVFTGPGTCQTGTCDYGSADVSCDCAADRCTQDPCASVHCDQPPSATCVGSSVRTFQSPGTCDPGTGQCSYTSSDAACAHGCAAGQCSGDPCAGVVCNQPPAATCSAGGDLVTPVSPGTCSGGTCSYSTTTAPCASGQSCSQGACVCTPESDSAFCARLGTTCGPASAPDNCGTPRSVSCGTCPTRISFTSNWQIIPGTGSQVVSVRCQGTVSTTATGGTSCTLASGNPVLIGIDGSTYNLYGGCTSNTTLHNCMTDITPSGADYLEAQPGSVARLLCAAMGWTLANTQSDRVTTADGAPTAPVAVVQTNPSVIGTADLANYSTYVTCEP